MQEKLENFFSHSRSEQFWKQITISTISVKEKNEVRAEICQKFGWVFGRFEDTKNSF